MGVSGIKDLFGLIVGIVYGIAHVVPGVSSGTFLVVFGCYDLVCEAFALKLDVIKKNLMFLIYFAVGTVGGLAGFVFVITYLLAGFEIQTNLFFMGLILGGVPLIVKIATKEEKFKASCVLPFILGLALVVSLFALEKFNAFESGAAQAVGYIYYIKIALFAFVAAVAMVMPGISGAFVLVAFGVYNVFIEALKSLDFSILIPAVIGIAIGIVAGARLILFLLKRYKLIVYSVIIGMVIGSAAPLFPGGLGLNAATFAGVLCLALGGAISLILGKRDSAAK